MRLVVVLIIAFNFSIASHYLYAQNRKAEMLQNDPSSGSGKVKLFDGSELAGFISFNDKTGIVSLSNKNNVGSYTSKTIAGFEFRDSALGRDRIFHAFDFMDPETGMKDFEFFEVLKEFKTFAVLAKKDRIKTAPKKALLKPRTVFTMTDQTKQTEISQTETIFFIDGNGKIEPYVKVKKSETERLVMDTQRTQKKFVKKDLLKKYTNKYYEEVMAFVEERSLNLKVKEDLVMVLNHYQYILEGLKPN
jgi:hypothetical protein